MNFVDIGIFVIIIFFTLVGLKRGVVKSLVKALGIILVAIIAYVFKDILANWLISFMPFFNFSGVYVGALALNVLVYKVLSFWVIFILLYCLLDVLTSIAGIADFILKATIILALPDKILGALVGFIEGTLISFVCVFIMSQMPATQSYVFESQYGDRLLNRTPIIRIINAAYTDASEDIYQIIDDYKDSENKEEFNVKIAQIFIKYNILDKKTIEEIKNKMGISDNISFGAGA